VLETAREPDIAAAAARRSVAVGRLASHSHGPGRHKEGLVIGYGRPPEHAFGAALAAFAEALAVAQPREP
jgi:GntR family transcriptional regulator/MocR family aminotransferase